MAEFHPGLGWRLKEDDEYVDMKHILIEWSKDANIRRIWVEVEEPNDTDKISTYSA